MRPWPPAQNGPEPAGLWRPHRAETSAPQTGRASDPRPYKPRPYRHRPTSRPHGSAIWFDQSFSGGAAIPRGSTSARAILSNAHFVVNATWVAHPSVLRVGEKTSTSTEARFTFALEVSPRAPPAGVAGGSCLWRVAHPSVRPE